MEITANKLNIGKTHLTLIWIGRQSSIDMEIAKKNWVKLLAN